MTVVACHFLVAAQQRESRFRMIKSHTLPTGFVVTTLTAFALLARVYIILPMACHAIGLQFLPERAVRMAALALQLFVAADQREACLLLMVESGRFPICFLVTGFTLGSKGAAMHVIPGVTSITCHRRLSLMSSIGMARVTLDLTVGAS